MTHLRQLATILIVLVPTFFATHVYAQAMPMFNDPLRIREVESYAEKLDLTNQQKEAVLQAYDRYVQAYERVRNSEVQKFEDLVTAFAERFGFMQFEIPQRDEIKIIIDKGQRAMSSIHRVDNSFFDSITGMLTEPQQGILKRIRNDRELAAYRIIVLEMLSELNRSARPNMSKLVNQVVDEESPETKVVLENYERRMLKHAEDSLDTIIEVIDLAFDMIDELGLREMEREEMFMLFMDEEKMVDFKSRGDQLMVPLQSQAYEISELNWKTWKQIDLQLTEEDRRPLAIKYFTRGFRDPVQGYNNISRRFEKAFDLDELSSDQKQALIVVQSEFETRSLSLATKYAKLLVQHWKYRTIDQQSGDAATQYDDEIEQADDARTKLVEGTLTRINAILGSSLVAKLDESDDTPSDGYQYRYEDSSSNAVVVESGEVEDLKDELEFTLAGGVDVPEPMSSTFATNIALQLGLNEGGEDIVTAVFGEYRDRYDEMHTLISNQSVALQEDTTLGVGTRLRKRQELTDDASATVASLDRAFFDDLSAVTGFARDDRFVQMLEQFRMRKRISGSKTTFNWGGPAGNTLDLVDVFILKDDPLVLTDKGRDVLEQAMLSYHLQADGLFSKIVETEYDITHLSDAMMLANEIEQSTNSGQMATNLQNRWREAFTALRDAKRVLTRSNQEQVNVLLSNLPMKDQEVVRMRYVKVAYPRIFKDTGDATTMLKAAQAIATLNPQQQGEITRMESQYAKEYWSICESMIAINEEAAFAESTGKLMSQGDMKRSIDEEKLRFQRSELNDRVRMRLRMTLNEDQVKEVPGLRLTVTAAAEK